MIETDEILLERLKCLPAHEAWSQFHAAYAPPLRRFLAGRGLNPAEVEDALQETMLALTELMPEFVRDSRKKFRNLLLTIAHRTAGKHQRSRVRRAVREAHYAADLEGLFGANSSAPNGAEASELESAWRHALLDEAAERYRQLVRFDVREWTCFTAYVLRGESARDVAAATGLSEAAIYTMKTRHGKRFRAFVMRLARELDGR